jgi:CLASP N terminal
MLHTPGRIRPTAGVTPYRAGQLQASVPDGPILELMVLIEKTKSDDWQRRVLAWENLVRKIPDGSAYLNGAAWFNTPKTLCHLVHPLSVLLTDPRSSVVRRVCTALLDLFHKCQSDARLLFKDIMPTILVVQAQTVQTIRTAVVQLVSEAIPQVQCKSVMPLWMDRLKDKSPAVREACSLYLGLALQSWTEEGYLTDEIWMQVGAALLKTMRDPSPTVRQNTKSALERMRHQHPHRWEALITDPNGPAARDMKLQQWLRGLGSSDQDAEDLSIASKYTYNSESRFISKSTNNLRISSPRLLKLGALSMDDDSGPPRHARTAVPFSIAVTHSNSAESEERKSESVTVTASGSARTVPLVRLLNPKANTPFSNLVHSPSPTVPARSTPPRPPTSRPHPSPQAKTYSALAHHPSNDEEDATGLDYSESNNSTSTSDLFDARITESPFIASMHELKKLASRRRSRNSILMQERFRISGAGNHANSAHSSAGILGAATLTVLEENSSGENENATPNHHDSFPRTPPPEPTTPKTPHSASSSSAPEHIVIAIRLLRKHKEHVDEIMETLKLEMDTLRDFDRSLEEPGRPTEDELVMYYESVDLCLEQRFAAGLKLRKEMNLLSTGQI